MLSLHIVKNNYEKLQEHSNILNNKLERSEEELRQLKHLQLQRDVQEVYVQTDAVNFDVVSSISNLKGNEPQELQFKSDLEIHKNKKVQTETYYTKSDEYILEKKDLLKKIQEYQITIKTLKDQVNSPKTEIFSQTSTDSAIESDYIDDNLNDILREMKIPRILSPLLTNDNFLNETVDLIKKVPEIIVTPSTPLEKVSSQLEFPYSFPNLVELPNDENLEDFKSISVKEKPFRRSKRKVFFTYNDFIKQQSWHMRLRRLAFKKKLNARRRKALHSQDAFLSSLKALKKSNINFMITNDSNVQSYSPFCSNKYQYSNFKYTNYSTEMITPSTERIVEKLTCTSTICKNSYMLMKNSPKGNKLVGFFNVKPETSTPTLLHSEQCHETRPPDTITNPSGNFIGQIADMVLEKLKNAGVLSKIKLQRLNSTSEPSDSFYSETETEIEQLFRKPPLEILKQNKKLWEEARSQNRASKSTDGSSQSRADENCNEIKMNLVGVAEEKHSNESPNAVFTGSVSTVMKKPPTDCLNTFKVPDLVSPIKSVAERFSNCVSSPSKSSVGRNLTLSPTDVNLDSSLNTNFSYYINELLADRKNLSLNLDTMLNCSFSEEKFLNSPCSKIISNLTKSPTCTQRRVMSLEKDGNKQELPTKTRINKTINKNVTTLARSKSPIKMYPTRDQSIENKSPKNVGHQIINCDDKDSNERQISSDCKDVNKVERSKRKFSPKDDATVPILRKSKRLELLNCDNNKDRNATEALDQDLHCDVTVESCSENVVEGEERTLNKSDKLVRIKKKKPVSKLQSRVLQQMKAKRNMMGQMKREVLGCDSLLSKNSVGDDCKNKEASYFSKIGSPKEECIVNKIKVHPATESSVPKNNKKSNDKICIVQNILIKPNSEFPIDLLNEMPKPLGESCNEDLLSQILHSMDKDRPKIVPTTNVTATNNMNPKPINSPEDKSNPIHNIELLETILRHRDQGQEEVCNQDKQVDIGDKLFRENLLDIAEVMQGKLKYDSEKRNTLLNPHQQVMQSVLLKKKKLPCKYIYTEPINHLTG